jgi:hypothetical protein
MTYVPRAYEDIVRDLLTTLTGGTVRETLNAPAAGVLLAPEKLRDRPVRRVSHLTGTIEVGVGADARRIPYKFTTADFELVATNGIDADTDAIRFREKGRRPIPNTPLIVNYYPVQTDPTPLTDLNVGSVVRTLMETIAREMALSYLQLEQVYQSAYLETATGSSLDKVVALVGAARLPTGHPVVKVRFARRANTPGRITIPAGTPLTDDAGNRYLTLDELTLEPYESTREVMAGGDSPATAPVEQGTLNRLELTIAGISEVSNPQPARRLTAPETDAELRRRARGALQGVVRGTVDALRFGLLSITGVQDLSIIEAPNGVPGEIKIDVAYNDNSPDVKALVARRIDELRPAGVRVVTGEAARRRVGLRVALTLAGTGLPSAEVNPLKAALEGKLAAYLANVAPGGTVRRARLAALALEDPRITDVRVTLLPEGEAEVEELTLRSSEVIDVVRPFDFPPPATEQQAGAQPATTSQVSVLLPVHLLPGVTLENARQAIGLAIDCYLASRGPEAALSVDGLAAAARDDTRYALIRGEALATVESADGRFLQLADGVGQYAPAAAERLHMIAVDIPVREGSV